MSPSDSHADYVAPSRLLDALLAARKACPPTVHKATKNTQQDYWYAGHEAVLLAGSRQHLLEHGLLLVLVCTEFAGAETVKDRAVWRWRGHFDLLHAESGEKLSLSFEATTIQNDKAAYVAATALDRTAHLRVLELAGSEEENPEHGGDGGAREPKARKERAPRAKPPEVKRPATYWRDGHATLVARATKAGINFEPADEYGLQKPMLPVPVFSAQAQQYPGLAYDHETVKGGYLRQVIFLAKDFGQQPAPVRLWVSYLVCRHELGKLEREEAEQALGGKATT